MGLTFRRASKADIETIAAIYERIHDAEESGLVTIGWERGCYPVMETAEDSVRRGDMYVADADGNVAAAGIINRIQVDVYADCDWIYKAPDDDVMVLHTLVVDPSAGGQGIGTAFVKFYEDTARSGGCSVLRIDTNARNSRARKMYAGLGYCEAAIVPTVFNGIEGVDLVLMEKFVGTEIQKRLRDMRDEKYAEFQAGLIPGVESERMIGVRTPQLRAYARELAKCGGAEDFLKELPHKYFDEMQLHAFIISGIKDFDRAMEETERFLPYVDNWATCDQLSPKVFAKDKDELLRHIDRWLGSDLTYPVRFAIGMLMEHLLDGDFDVSYMEKVANIRSDEYYINMMIAWYFATALAKQHDAALQFLLDRRLDKWTHNKTIQKARESRRITPEQKEYLKGLRIRSVNESDQHL